MIRLLYISTAKISLSSDEMNGLLRLSRFNNAKVGITGLLLAGGNRFMQVSEGQARPSEQYL